jgi:CMP/dCMP kinase
MKDPSVPIESTSGLVVALDGPGSSGKSSVGAAAATELGYRFVDTGLLYRALTWLALERGIPEDDVARLVGLVPEVELVPDEKGRLAHVSVDGTAVTSHVRGGEVDTRVSAISRVPQLRAALLERQREIAAPGRIIVAGRDIGTVVLPDADLKIFLQAAPEERARRRAHQTGREAELDRIRDAIKKRDRQDSERETSPLKPARDAVILDTTALSLDEVVSRVLDLARGLQKGA